MRGLKENKPLAIHVSQPRFHNRKHKRINQVPFIYLLFYSQIQTSFQSILKLRLCRPAISLISGEKKNVSL